MGLCGSKSDAKKTKGQAASKENTAEPKELKIVMERSEGEVLGMTLTPLEDRMLYVKELKETGLVVSHNAKNEAMPDMQVQVHDIITVVNDVCNDSEKMLEAIQADKVELTIRRVPEATAAANTPTDGTDTKPKETSPDTEPAKDKEPVADAPADASATEPVEKEAQETKAGDKDGEMKVPEPESKLLVDQTANDQSEKPPVSEQVEENAEKTKTQDGVEETQVDKLDDQTTKVDQTEKVDGSEGGGKDKPENANCEAEEVEPSCDLPICSIFGMSNRN